MVRLHLAQVTSFQSREEGHPPGWPREGFPHSQPRQSPKGAVA